MPGPPPAPAFQDNAALQQEVARIQATVHADVERARHEAQDLHKRELRLMRDCKERAEAEATKSEVTNVMILVLKLALQASGIATAATCLCCCLGLSAEAGSAQQISAVSRTAQQLALACLLQKGIVRGTRFSMMGFYCACLLDLNQQSGYSENETHVIMHFEPGVKWPHERTHYD